MPLIQHLCLLLIAAHVLGKLSARSGQPKLLGSYVSVTALPVALRTCQLRFDRHLAGAQAQGPDSGH